jgi:RNA polymerase sigma-70 factor (ECF subfamily)
VERFNARDFDALRQMLADDVRLDLVGRVERQSARLVGEYFTRYDQNNDWHMSIGRVEGRLAILAHDPAAPEVGPTYFIFVEWSAGRLVFIRDYRYCRYVMRDTRVG